MDTNVLVKNQEILLTIKRIGINGEGIGYYKRLAIFVKGALPKEEVIVKVTEVNTQYARAEMKRIKGDPSVSRVVPPCKYSDKCGGCQLQHVEYTMQCKIKQSIVKESFDKYYSGKLNERLFKETIGQDNPYHYRNKVKLPVRYDGEKLVTGLYAMDTNRLVYIDNCLVEKEDLRVAVDEICEYLTKYQIIAYNPKTHDGVLRHIIARSSKLTNDIQVTLILYKKDQRTIKVAKELVKIKNIKSVYISINDDLEAIENFGKNTFLVAGNETITEQLGDFKFELLPNAFFQLNLEQTNKLYNEIIKLAKLNGYENVIDAYCGVGTIGTFLSKYAKEVRGIDNNKEAIQNANKNVKLNGITNTKFYNGNILSYMHKWETEGFIPDVLVVDPPRTGLELKFLNYLQTNPVKKIIYVSCNPSTLAKNCNHLQKKYHIYAIQPLDMFPNTSNVETIVLLFHKVSNKHINVKVDFDTQESKKF